jgi:lysozyme
MLAVLSTGLEAMQQQLIDHEGLRVSAYQDSLGYWTIGVGRLIDVRRGGRLSHDEVLLLLHNDIVAHATDAVARWAWVEDLDEIRQRAMVDLHFNVGGEGLAKFRVFLQAVERKDYEAAADALTMSRWFEQVKNRAPRIVHMIRTGHDPGVRT